MPKKGGKLKAKEVKDFLSASYDKTPPNDLDGYILDKSLSTATAKVYYNPQTNHAVVAHRGTQGVMDWGNNLAYAVGAYNYTNRYKQGKKTQDQAEKKYGKQNISTLGHSQGAILARKLGTDTKEVINVNPAYMNERPAKNEYNIRSSTDVVSGLYAPVAKTREFLFPKYSEKHDITIPSQSATDVLGEHSYDILDRMGDAEIGVGAGNIFSSNNIMKAGKRYSRLGYSGEDIDWIGGGVIHTNNNCGAVGTPYVNRGTNPFGTRGAGFHDGHSSVDKYFKPPKGLRRGAGKMKGGATPQQIQNLAMVLFGQDLPTNQAQADLFAMIDQINLGLENPANFDEANDLYGLLLNEMGWGEDWENNFIFNEIEHDEDEGSTTEEEMSDEEVEGGKIKKPSLKSFQKGITKVGTAFGKAGETLNPMSYAIKNKGTRDAMISSGETTHDYLLPAVVSAGKPIYDATAITASTMLTGNPVLGKAVSQTLWNEMVAKKGYDPRENQKSAELGELSSTFGQAVSKPYSAALGGMGRDKAYRYRLKAGMRVDEDSDEELADLMGQMSFPPAEEKARPSAIPPELKRPVIIRRPPAPVEFKKEVVETGKRKAEEKAEGKEKKGKGRGGKRLDTNTYIEEVKEELRNEYNPLWERLNTLLQSDTLSDELEEEIMDLLDEGVEEEINLIFPGLYTEQSVSVIRQKIAKMENLLKKINSLTGRGRKGGAREGRERLGMAQEDIISRLAQEAEKTKERRKELVKELKTKNRSARHERNILKLTNKLDILEHAIKNFEKNEETIKLQMEALKKYEDLMTKEQTKRYKKLMKKVEKLSLR